MRRWVRSLIPVQRLFRIVAVPYRPPRKVFWIESRLDNLLKLKISPQNSAGELLNDEEFANQKAAISTEMIRLEAKVARIEKDAAHWINPCEKTFNFACYATDHLKKTAWP